MFNLDNLSSLENDVARDDNVVSFRLASNSSIKWISDNLLDCTPRIISEAVTPDISMRSDTLNETLEPVQMVDLSEKSPEVSIMIQGSQELATNHFLLDPCPETYLATSVASPISSAMTKGNEELGSERILLNPCADPFFSEES